MLILGLVFVEIGTTSAVNASRTREATAALLLADGGVDYAAWAIQSDYNNIATQLASGTVYAPATYNSPTLSVTGGTFHFTATKPFSGVSNLTLVTATGTSAKGRAQQIRSVFKNVPTVPACFDHAIFSNHNLTFKGNTYINGQPALSGKGLHANGNISFSGSSYTVIGDATATGSITNAGRVQGTVSPYGPHLSMPALDMDYYASMADISYNGDVTFNNAAFGIGTFAHPRIIYVKGKVSLSGNITGVGMIVAKGGVTITGNTQYSDSGSALAILTAGTFDMHGTADVVGLCYAHNVTDTAAFTQTGTSTIYGGIVADVVTLKGTPDVTWDPRLKSINGLPGAEGQVDVISWERI
jgi:hypothetical protein